MRAAYAPSALCARRVRATSTHIVFVQPLVGAFMLGFHEIHVAASFSCLCSSSLFFSGWDDSELGEVVSGPGGDFDILDSPHKLFYEHTLRARHKENNDKAGNLLSLLLVNRAVSMFNILLNESRIRVSSDVNPSKYATNEIKLSIGF